MTKQEAKIQIEKLVKLEPGDINIIHEYLSSSNIDNLIKISSTIINLYEIAESEREIKFREQHGIDNKTYPENAECKRSFFVNPSPEKPGYDKVEHEYFLNLLYSLSFTLYLARKNYNDFNQRKSDHLFQKEYFLNTLENLYIALDTLAVLIYLTCGLDKKDKSLGIYFSLIKGDLKNSVYKKYFTNIDKFDINKYPLNMLNRIRNMRAHRPFLDWEENKIVSEPKHLSKVKSVCRGSELFDLTVDDFITECFDKTTNIISDTLENTLTVYRQRLEKNEVPQPHQFWGKFLAGE